MHRSKRWLEMTVDSKLASFQQALLEKQNTWEMAQDTKLQALADGHSKSSKRAPRRSLRACARQQPIGTVTSCPR